jgi:hypothetical protein
MKWSHGSAWMLDCGARLCPQGTWPWPVALIAGGRYRPACDRRSLCLRWLLRVKKVPIRTLHRDPRQTEVFQVLHRVHCNLTQTGNSPTTGEANKLATRLVAGLRTGVDIRRLPQFGA